MLQPHLQLCRKTPGSKQTQLPDIFSAREYSCMSRIPLKVSQHCHTTTPCLILPPANSTTAVHLFQRKLCSFLSDKMNHILKIYYIYGDAATQYKNRRSFINLHCHKDDSGTGGISLQHHLVKLHVIKLLRDFKMCPNLTIWVKNTNKGRLLSSGL
jgi:hypothetical protein